MPRYSSNSISVTCCATCRGVAASTVARICLVAGAAGGRMPRDVGAGGRDLNSVLRHRATNEKRARTQKIAGDTLDQRSF